MFGDRYSGAYMQKFAWTRIVRHHMVKSGASPDDPALADYWAMRRRKAPPLSIDKANLRLFEAQHGRCRTCGGWLLPVAEQPQSPREWEQWLIAARTTITQIAARKPNMSDDTDPRLIHTRCHDQHSANRGKRPALLSAREPRGLA